MGDARAAVYANELEACINATVKLVEGLAPEKRYMQTQPGKAHPAWLVGHLAGSLDNNVNHWTFNAERIFPKEWRRRFAPHEAGGEPITDHPNDYPAWDDVLVTYKKVGAACIDGIRALTTAELEGDPRGNVPDRFKELFGNTEANIGRMIRHDSHHRGQIAMLAAMDG